jgi:hypothetical protein
MAVQEDVLGIYGHLPLARLLPFEDCLLIFARLIDDYTVVLAGVIDQHTLEFLKAIDARVAPYLKITWKVSSVHMDTLDLHVFVDETCLRTRRLEYRTHQKPGTGYTFLPFSSQHPRCVMKAVVKAEVTRHATSCSTYDWFVHMRDLYIPRQLSRDFPAPQLF